MLNGQISLYVVFSETTSFTKVDGKYCKTHYKEEVTLEKATEKCKNDEDCTLFYSNSCNDEGPFKLCQNQSEIEDFNSTTCAYSKKQGWNNLDYGYCLFNNSDLQSYHLL